MIILGRRARREARLLIERFGREVLALVVAEVERARRVALDAALTAFEESSNAGDQDQQQGDPPRRVRRRRVPAPRGLAAKVGAEPEVAREVAGWAPRSEGTASAPRAGARTPQRCKLCGKVGFNARTHPNHDSTPPASDERAHTPTSSAASPAASLDDVDRGVPPPPVEVPPRLDEAPVSSTSDLRGAPPAALRRHAGSSMPPVRGDRQGRPTRVDRFALIEARAAARRAGAP